MPRTQVTTYTPSGSATTVGVQAPFAACDNVNGNFYYFKGREILVVKNDGGSSATLTVQGRPDPMGRTEDCTLTLAADAAGVLGPFQLVGWRTDDGKIEFDSTSSDLKVLVIEV